MENVKVIIWGLGSMGGGMADMLLHKKGVEIVGVVGRNKKNRLFAGGFLLKHTKNEHSCIHYYSSPMARVLHIYLI